MPAVHLRRVGFRRGTVDELRALHSVEAPIEEERGSNRMPHGLDEYIAFARSLPSQFDDHSWLVEDAASGAPVASAYCWSSSTGDPRAMECDILVRRSSRRQSIASRLFAEICGETAEEGRSLLTWSTFDAVPAGGFFSRELGARIARVNRTSELHMVDIDWAVVAQWAEARRARELGYRLETIVGPFPEQLRGDAVIFHRIMQTAPREDLDVAKSGIDADFVAEHDQALRHAGRERWTILVRHAEGACVGGTEVTFDVSEPETAHQQNTGIDPAHRGTGLAQWVKAAMLERIRHAEPQVVSVRTSNASSNAPMLAINNALGFKVLATRTEWQLDLADFGHGLG